MILAVLGMVAAGVLLWAAGQFARARVANVKTLLAWLAALAGLSLAAMLFLTGRGIAAVAGLVFLGPLAWTYWQESRGATATPRPARPAPSPRMNRTEALAVLGLPPAATEPDIRAAWKRLVRAVHPDNGGTDWLAARVNQARDVLLK